MVKEIKELEDEVKEILVEEPVEDEQDWEEKDVEVEEEPVEDEQDWEEKDVGVEEDFEEEKEDFSIGDLSLARGEAKEEWGAKNLEEEVDEFEDSGSFGGVDFEEEDEGFSYETMSADDGFSYDGGISSDLYGNSNNFSYDGGGSTQGGYDVGGSSGTYSVGESVNDSPMANYNIGNSKKNPGMVEVYNVQKEGKKSKRKGKSGLEVGVRKKNRKVSMY
jgi:hypothetical protein